MAPCDRVSHEEHSVFGEHHDLLHEFPEYKDRIDQLKAQDAEFARLCEEFDALDEELLKIPICSLYLATVRRAMLYPFSCKRFFSFSSESGLRLFSASTHSCNIFLISLLETSSPVSVVNPSEKKYFS